MPRLPLLALVVAVPPVRAAFECAFSVSSYHFNLSPLRGVHTASHAVDSPPTVENTTIFLDLCQDLQWNNDVYKPADRCEDGTQGSPPNPPSLLHFGFGGADLGSVCDQVHAARGGAEYRADHPCGGDISLVLDRCKDEFTEWSE